MQIPPNMLYFNCQRGILTGGCLSKKARIWPYIVPKLSWFITERPQLTPHIHPIEKIRCPCVWRVVRPQKFPSFFFGNGSPFGFLSFKHLEFMNLLLSLDLENSCLEPLLKLQQRTFLVHFQPVASLKTNRMQKTVTRNSRGLAQSSEGKSSLFQIKNPPSTLAKVKQLQWKNPISTFMFNLFVVNCSDTVAIYSS